MRKVIAAYSIIPVILSFFLQPFQVMGTETPLREMPIMPPSGSTTPTPSAAQTQKPVLPVPMETKDAEGRTILTIKDAEMIVQDSLAKDAAENEKERLRGFIVGYWGTIQSPDQAEGAAQRILEGTTDWSKAYQAGFLVGIEAALPSRELIRDTLEAIGVPKIPDAQQSTPPVNPPPPKTPAGPMLP